MKFFRVICAVLLATAALFAQPTILKSFQGTVLSRWDFQKAVPKSEELFSGQISPQDNLALLQILIGMQPAAQNISSTVSAGGSQTDSLSASSIASPTYSDVWKIFALALSLEKNKPGDGKGAFQILSPMIRGNIAINFELSRLASQNGLDVQAKIYEMETHRSLLEKGYVRIPELAKMEILLARQALSEGNYALVRQKAAFASRLDPLCPWIPFLHLELELREKSFTSWDLSAIWARAGETFRLLRYYDTQSLLLVNISRTLRLGFGLFGALTLLVLFAKYFSRIFHLWAERLPQEVDLRLRYLALGLVLLSLAIGGLGYAVLGIILVLLLWKHCTFLEKSVLRLVILGLIALPIAISVEENLLRHWDNNLGLNLYHEAYSRGYEDPLIEKIKSFKPKDKTDVLYADLAFSLAYKKQGNYLKANEFARKASQAEPKNAYAVLNNGNLAMVNFDYPAAKKIYAEAQILAPDLTETWFNASQAQLYANNSGDHKKYLDEAAKLDAQWVTQFLKFNDENFPEYPATRKVMDPMLRMGQAWNSVLAALASGAFLNVGIKMGVYEVTGIWILVAAILTMIFIFFRNRKYSLHLHGTSLFHCKICGKTMCRICRKGVHCQTCFKTVSGIHDTRIKLQTATNMRDKATKVVLRTGKIMNTLFPGSGHIYLGQGAGRFLWTLVTCLLFATLWQINHGLMEYPSFVIGPFSWLPWIPIGLLYLLFSVKRLNTSIIQNEVIPSSQIPSREVLR